MAGSGQKLKQNPKKPQILKKSAIEKREIGCV
jgi:hypothetical protein